MKGACATMGGRALLQVLGEIIVDFGVLVDGDAEFGGECVM